MDLPNSGNKFPANLNMKGVSFFLFTLFIKNEAEHWNINK